MRATWTTRRGVGALAAAVAGLSVVGGAAAASSPSAATRPASGVSARSAQLNGVVAANGQPTTWYFEFGTTTGYGTRTATVSVGGATRPAAVGARIDGLAAGTTYHYRLVASNATGTTLGADQSFTTTGPPVAQTGAAQSVATTTAALTGSVDPRGRPTAWYFDYGPTTAYGSRTPRQHAGAGVGAVAITAALTGLVPSTAYYFRLVATSNGGTSVGADMAFRTLTAITIDQPARRVVAGHYTTLSGTVTGAGPGVAVSILAQPFGASSFVQVTSVLTGANGGWTYAARPTIQTSYEASANGGTTTPVTIGVQPGIRLMRITGARFSAHVSAASSFAGKQVKFQRRSGGKWVTVRQSRLNARSTAILPASLLPHGASTVRVAMSVNQAGPGYLGGLSRTLVYRRG
jgi:hypothetical protein